MKLIIIFFLVLNSLTLQAAPEKKGTLPTPTDGVTAAKPNGKTPIKDVYEVGPYVDNRYAPQEAIPDEKPHKQAQEEK